MHTVNGEDEEMVTEEVDAAPGAGAVAGAGAGPVPPVTPVVVFRERSLLALSREAEVLSVTPVRIFSRVISMTMHTARRLYSLPIPGMRTIKDCVGYICRDAVPGSFNHVAIQCQFKVGYAEQERGPKIVVTNGRGDAVLKMEWAFSAVQSIHMFERSAIPTPAATAPAAGPAPPADSAAVPAAPGTTPAASAPQAADQCWIVMVVNRPPRFSNAAIGTTAGPNPRRRTAYTFTRVDGTPDQAASTCTTYAFQVASVLQGPGNSRSPRHFITHLLHSCRPMMNGELGVEGLRAGQCWRVRLDQSEAWDGPRASNPPSWGSVGAVLPLSPVVTHTASYDVASTAHAALCNGIGRTQWRSCPRWRSLRESSFRESSCSRVRLTSRRLPPTPRGWGECAASPFWSLS